MMDDFTKRMVELYRQDLRDMANGTYVPPPPHHSRCEGWIPESLSETARKAWRTRRRQAKRAA